jgi:hypothetical protein
VHRLRVAAVLAADPEVQVRAHLAALGRGDVDQPPDALLVDALERDTPKMPFSR